MRTAVDSLSYEPVGRVLSLSILFQLFGSEICGEHHHPLSTIINQVLWGWIRQNLLHLERQTDNNEIMASETGDKSAISPAAALKSYLLKIFDKALRIELRWEQKQNASFLPLLQCFVKAGSGCLTDEFPPVRLQFFSFQLNLSVLMNLDLFSNRLLTSLPINPLSFTLYSSRSLMCKYLSNECQEY